jgi:hypothetical protein
MMSFITCTLHQILLGSSNQEDEMGGTCGTHGGWEMYCTKFWSEDLKGRDQSEYVGIDGRIILE